MADARVWGPRAGRARAVGVEARRLPTHPIGPQGPRQPSRPTHGSTDRPSKRDSDTARTRHDARAHRATQLAECPKGQRRPGHRAPGAQPPAVRGTQVGFAVTRGTHLAPHPLRTQCTHPGSLPAAQFWGCPGATPPHCPLGVQQLLGDCPASLFWLPCGGARDAPSDVQGVGGPGDRSPAGQAAYVRESRVDVRGRAAGRGRGDSGSGFVVTNQRVRVCKHAAPLGARHACVVARGRAGTQGHGGLCGRLSLAGLREVACGPPRARRWLAALWDLHCVTGVVFPVSCVTVRMSLAAV